MKFKFLTFIIQLTSCLSLAFAQSAADKRNLELSVKSTTLSKEYLDSLLKQIGSCYEASGEEAYRKKFCEEMKGEMQGFDYYSAQGEKELSEFTDKLKDELKAKNLPEYLKSFKKMIDEEYKYCNLPVSDQGDYSGGGLEDEGYPPEVMNSVKVNPIFAYFPETDTFSLSPDDMNGRYMELINSLNDPEIENREELLKRANDLARRALLLRKTIYLENPSLLLPVSMQVQYGFGYQTSFWSYIYEKTGLTKEDFPDKQKEAFELRHAVDTAKTMAWNYKLESSAEVPQSGERAQVRFSENGNGELIIEPPKRDTMLSIKKDKPLLTVDVLVKEAGLSPDIARAALDELKQNQRSKEEAKVLTKEVASILTGPHQKDIKAISAEYRSINAAIEESRRKAADKDIENYEPSDYCESRRDDRIKELASTQYVQKFYGDKKNKAFLNQSFDKARGLLQRAIARSNLSEESKVQLNAHLDEVTIQIPEVSQKDIETFTKKNADLYFKALELYPDADPLTLVEDIQKEMGYWDQYSNFSGAKKFLGTNAFYNPDNLDGQNNHSVTCTCNISSQAVAQNNPDFLIGVLGHELGHSLDPGLAIRTHDRYSSHSLEMMDDLKKCLIATNKDLSTKQSEDYADHWESIMREQMILEDSGKPDWAMRKLKMSLEQYSVICEGNANVMEAHSDNPYRSHHVMSNPKVREEFSELKTPIVPYCEQIKLSEEKE